MLLPGLRDACAPGRFAAARSYAAGGSHTPAHHTVINGSSSSSSNCKLGILHMQGLCRQGTSIGQYITEEVLQ